MQSVAKICVIGVMVFFTKEVRAQNDSLPKAAPTNFWSQPEDSLKPNKLERTAYVLGSSLAFSLFDYIGFNMTRYNSHASVIAFRILQAGLQTGLSYFLYKKCGLNSAIAFNLIWLTWGDDWGFYGWAYTTRFYPWEDNSGFRGGTVSWAGWTPIGLLRKKGSLIAVDALVAQAIIGLSISIAIL
jgi:hypothetical protein